MRRASASAITTSPAQWRRDLRPAFLVDGITEQRFVQLVCADRPVKLTNLNGKSVSTSALAKQLATLIRLWKQRYYPIVVVVDLETRTQSASDFAADLIKEVRQLGVYDDLILGVADRMIENWMIADSDLWSEQIIPDNVEGNSGATIVKRYMAHYDKVANGPELLQRSRASQIALRSPSFAAFKAAVALL